ncbi:MAG: polyphosphate polymerase domain-containing protein [Erysipelotrichaceae bacterium]
MKYRHEIKYTINSKHANYLMRQLSLVLTKDQNKFNEDGSYLIKSLYFDTMDNKLYLEKLDGILYRKKYRIRIYNNDDTFIRLEKKMKHNNMTAKKQTLINRQDYDKILKGNIRDINTKEPLFLEFINEMKNNNLLPSIIVSYHRMAFTYPLSDVRITFDYHIQSGLYNYELFDTSKPNFDILNEKYCVLEVKYNEFLPTFIENILQSIPLQREAVSKFARCRSIK